VNKLFGVLGLLFGGFLLWGVKQKWNWLVDPPEDLSPFYSQAFLKTYFGPNAPRIVAKFIGVGFIALSIIFIIFG